MISLKLPLKQVNIIIAALGKQPLEVVIDTFSAVHGQTQAQVAEIQAGPPKPEGEPVRA
jgi:hypothetical protein